MSLRQQAIAAKKSGQQAASAASMVKTGQRATPLRVCIAGKDFPLGSTMTFRILDYTSEGVVEIKAKTFKQNRKTKNGDSVFTKKVPVPTLATSEQLARIMDTEVGYIEEQIPGTNQYNQVEVTFKDAFDLSLYRIPVAITEFNIGEGEVSEAAKALAAKIDPGRPFIGYLELSKNQFNSISPQVQAKQSEEANKLDSDRPIYTVDQLDLGSLGKSLPYPIRVVATSDPQKPKSAMNRMYNFLARNVPTAHSDKARDEYAWMDDLEQEITEEQFSEVMDAIRTDMLAVSDWEWETGLRLNQATRPNASTGTGTAASAKSTRQAPAVSHQREAVEEEDVFEDTTGIDMVSRNPQTEEAADVTIEDMAEEETSTEPPKRTAQRWRGGNK